jgi:hypothetical protein
MLDDPTVVSATGDRMNTTTDTQSTPSTSQTHSGAVDQSQQERSQPPCGNCNPAVDRYKNGIQFKFYFRINSAIITNQFASTISEMNTSTQKVYKHVVINNTYGGFHIANNRLVDLLESRMTNIESREIQVAFDRYLTKLTSITEDERRTTYRDFISSYFEDNRTSDTLVNIIKEARDQLIADATSYSDQKSIYSLVVEQLPYSIDLDPDSVGYRINEYDGLESVEAMPHRVVVNYLNKIDINGTNEEKTKYLLGVYDLMEELKLRQVNSPAVTMN